MPNRIFMQIDGIESASLDTAYKDHCECMGFDHDMQYQWSAAKRNIGAATEIEVGPVEIIKQVNIDSPPIYQALHQRKLIEKVTFIFERDNPKTGRRQEYFKIKLEGCRIALAHPYVDPRSDEGLLGGFYEKIGIAYNAITWTWLDGNIESSFDFTDPTAGGD